MPTSILLAVLVGAGLLALAPALVRRHDPDERLAADREASQATVLKRASRSRTTPSPTPLNPPDPVDPLPHVDDSDASSAGRKSWERAGAARARSVPLTSTTAALRMKEAPVAGSAELRAWWRRRHRRVLLVLVLLNIVELLGVIMVGPGFWFGAAASAALLAAFVWFLRMRALREDVSRRAARRVRVPSQTAGASRAEPEDEVEPSRAPAAVGESAPAPELEAEPEAEEPPGGVEPPPRRRTGGIRGRSYESPASL